MEEAKWAVNYILITTCSQVSAPNRSPKGWPQLFWRWSKNCCRFFSTVYFSLGIKGVVHGKHISFLSKLTSICSGSELLLNFHDKEPVRTSAVKNVILTLRPPNKLSSAKFVICFNFLSTSMSLKVGENVVWVSGSFDPDEMLSFSASHLDPTCLHMGLCFWLGGGVGVKVNNDAKTTTANNK